MLHCTVTFIMVTLLSQFCSTNARAGLLEEDTFMEDDEEFDEYMDDAEDVSAILSSAMSACKLHHDCKVCLRGRQCMLSQPNPELL